MVLGCVLTYICVEYEIYWNIQLALVISPIVFPLAFSINESYRRREKVQCPAFSFSSFHPAVPPVFSVVVLFSFPPFS